MPQFKNNSNTPRIIVTTEGAVCLAPKGISEEVTLVEDAPANARLSRAGVKAVKPKKEKATDE